MVWSNIATFSVGQTLTAARMNAIRLNLEETSAAKVTTAGDLVYGTGANALARLGIGAQGSVLRPGTNAPQWDAPLAALGNLTTNVDDAKLVTWGAIRSLLATGMARVVTTSGTFNWPWRQPTGRAILVSGQGGNGGGGGGGAGGGGANTRNNENPTIVNPATYPSGMAGVNGASGYDLVGRQPTVGTDVERPANDRSPYTTAGGGGAGSAGFPGGAGTATTIVVSGTTYTSGAGPAGASGPAGSGGGGAIGRVEPGDHGGNGGAADAGRIVGSSVLDLSVRGYGGGTTQNPSAPGGNAVNHPSSIAGGGAGGTGGAGGISIAGPNGGNGAPGYAGGKGGVAVLNQALTGMTFNQAITVTVGAGGAGGRGGRGGTGGRNNTTFAILAVGTDGGDGTDGATGAAGYVIFVPTMA